MSDHVPSVKTVRLLRRQIGQLLAISETPPLFLSIPDEALSISIVRSMHETTLSYREGNGKGRTTLLWPLFFADALEKVNRLTEGPMRRWGLMGDPPRQKAPKRYALKSDEVQCLKMLAATLDRALQGVKTAASGPLISASSSPPLRANAARNKWLYEQYCDPSKTVKVILAEARKNGWILSSNMAVNRAVESHCKSSGIPMPNRKQSSIKQD